MSPIRVTFARAGALTIVAGSVGWATDRVAVHAGATFPSFGYLVGEVVWKVWTLAVLAWATRRFEGRGPDAVTAGLTVDPDEVRHAYPWRGALAVGALAGVAAATVGSSSTSAGSYGQVRHVGIALVLAELLIRYPLTVLAEEAFFRGWLQPRLGASGPIASSVLWGMYHLQQAGTMPSLVLLGLVLGFLRSRTGTVRVTAAVHYVANAAFFVVNYV
jgi:membrane protease YdiL (CAAX protease family)